MSPVRRRVISVITIVPGSAAVCIRAATFTASPSAVYSYRRSDPTLPTMTGPLLMPARIRKSMPCCLQLAGELVGGIEHVERGEDGALGVVLVRDRGAEEREQRIALELGDRALVAKDRGT